MISIVVGTRPEIIKMAPIIFGLQEEGLEFEIVHSGQHYDLELSDIFFQELELPQANHRLKIGSGSHGRQTATALIKLENLFTQNRPQLILAEGDTNTVLASALAGVKLGIPIGHVEAGLRSYDIRMPEEHNRRLTDHLSSQLFAPTSHSAEILRKENVWGKIHVTGNTVIDSCLRYMPLAEKKSEIMSELKFEQYALATAHRAENVDDPLVIKNFVRIFTNNPIPIVYPIHPRTAKRLKAYGLFKQLSNSPNIQLLPPVGYFDFLILMKNCKFIITDSGGIQEEATSPNIKKKVFVLRISTERPEAVEAGYAEVLGTEYDVAIARINHFVNEGKEPDAPSPFGKGDAATKTVKILRVEVEGAWHKES